MAPSEFTSRMDRVREDVHRRGLSVVADLPPEDGRRLLPVLAGALGRCVSFVGQPDIMDIRPTRNCGGKSYGGTAHFPLHTDLAWYPTPPRYLAMFCVDAGEGDGDATFADVHDVLDCADDADRRAWSTTPIHFPAPSHAPWAGHTAPIIERRAGAMACRFNTRDIADTLDGPTRRFAETLETHEQVVPWRAGHLFVYDNWRFCHGRRSVSKGADSTRWLLRMYADPV
ncbi:MAG: TauD/TfdA family dioxygenase [Alphaproteobacteria bacterium]